MDEPLVMVTLNSSDNNINSHVDNDNNECKVHVMLNSDHQNKWEIYGGTMLLEQS